MTLSSSLKATTCSPEDSLVKTANIGILDSGFGGLTVMRAISTLLPHENLLYFGDTAHLPYGTKSPEAICQFVHKICTFLASKEIKVLVIACHTASCVALQTVQKQFPFPIIGVIHPSITHLKSQELTQNIAVIGTRGTIASQLYQTLLQEHLPKTTITALHCQLFVHLVEEGHIEDTLAETTIREYLTPLQKKNIDTLLLGCTHFPLLSETITKVLGPHVTLIDPGTNCAQALKDLLQEKDLLHPQRTPGIHKFYVSDDPEKFQRMGEKFLLQPLTHVEKASIF